MFTKLKEAQQKTASLEHELQMGWKDDVHAAWESSKKKLIQLEKWETKMLCNQACINWTEFGDRNSKFFHALIKERRKHQTIELARSDGTLISNAAEI